MPMFTIVALPLCTLSPVVAACRPVVRITANGATLCGHEKIALSPGARSVRLTCLNSRRQIDFRGGMVLLACGAGRQAKLRLCTTNTRMLCVSPKGDGSIFQSDQDATTLAWSPVITATRYQVAVSGHGVNWQTSLVNRSINYREIANLKPGNAYLVKIIAYQDETKLTEVETALNISALQTIANSQSK
jgi:sulfate adenylyltransferase subunit 1 (EFTu-like GTPase family)